MIRCLEELSVTDPHLARLYTVHSCGLPVEHEGEHVCWFCAYSWPRPTDLTPSDERNPRNE